MIDINYNIKTGETTQRDLTSDEIAGLKADQLEAQKKQAAAVIKATQKAALLDKLGITADEAALLLS
jgi:hypothetical protein